MQGGEKIAAVRAGRTKGFITPVWTKACTPRRIKFGQTLFAFSVIGTLGASVEVSDCRAVAARTSVLKARRLAQVPTINGRAVAEEWLSDTATLDLADGLSATLSAGYDDRNLNLRWKGKRNTATVLKPSR